MSWGSSWAMKWSPWPGVCQWRRSAKSRSARLPGEAREQGFAGERYRGGHVYGRRQRVVLFVVVVLAEGRADGGGGPVHRQHGQDHVLVPAPLQIAIAAAPSAVLSTIQAAISAEESSSAAAIVSGLVHMISLYPPSWAS